MKTMLTTAVVSASLLAALSVAPSAQAHFDGLTAKRGHAANHVRSHKRKAYKPHVIGHYDKRTQYFRKGYPDDCAQFKRRARLTGNAYWRYATRRCVTDHYKPY